MEGILNVSKLERALFLGLVHLLIHLDMVFVELVLHQQIISHALVQCLGLKVSCRQLLILALIDLDRLLELELQESHIVASLIIAEASLAVAVGHLQVLSQFVRIALVDFAIEAHVRLRWSEPAAHYGILVLHVMLLLRHCRDLRLGHHRWLSGDTLSDELSYHSLKLLITSL